MFGYEGAQGVDFFDVGLAGTGIEVLRAVVAFAKGGVRAQRARQAALVQHAAREDGDATLRAQRDQAVEWRRVKEVEDGLHAVNASAENERQADIVPLVGQRHAKGADLAGNPESFEFVQPVAFHTPVGPVEVHLEEINRVHAKAPEGSFRLAGDVAARKASLDRLRRCPLDERADGPGFGGDEGAGAAPALERLGDDVLGASVKPGGIQEIHAAVPAKVQGLDGFLLVERAEDTAETKGAEAEARDRLLEERKRRGLHRAQNSSKAIWAGGTPRLASIWLQALIIMGGPHK